MPATVRPRDIAARTRRRIAAEKLADLVAVDAEVKNTTAEPNTMAIGRGSRLVDIHGVGPVREPSLARATTSAVRSM